MDKHLKTIILIGLVIAGVGAICMFAVTNTKSTEISQQKSVSSVTASELNEENVVSPDGKYELNMKSTATKDAISYEFTTIDDTGRVKHQIYSSFIPKNQTLSIPFNTFSPDNKLVFLTGIKDGVKNYLIFNVSGKQFSNGLQNLEILELFNAKNPNYKITDVTGWAAPTLLVVNTDKVSGGEGPSFWFDVTNRNFIRLSTRFN